MVPRTHRVTDGVLRTSAEGRESGAGHSPAQGPAHVAARATPGWWACRPVFICPVCKPQDTLGLSWPRKLTFKLVGPPKMLSSTLPALPCLQS